MKELDLIIMKESGISQSRIDKLSEAIRRASFCWRNKRFFTKNGSWRKNGVVYTTETRGGSPDWTRMYKPPAYIPRQNTPEVHERCREA